MTPKEIKALLNSQQYVEVGSDSFFRIAQANEKTIASKALLEQLKAEGKNYKVGQFPMRALGRARASNEIDGFVKVLADATTDEILGVHILGARASDLIAQSVVAMEYRASAEDIARICHAHPTYSEAIKEACLDATAKRPIHM